MGKVIYIFIRNKIYVLIEKRNMRRMRNPLHEVQVWSKELSKPPLTKDGYTRGWKGHLIERTKWNSTKPWRPIQKEQKAYTSKRILTL